MIRSCPHGQGRFACAPALHGLKYPKVLSSRVSIAQRSQVNDRQWRSLHRTRASRDPRIWSTFAADLVRGSLGSHAGSGPQHFSNLPPRSQRGRPLTPLTGCGASGRGTVFGIAYLISRLPFGPVSQTFSLIFVGYHDHGAGLPGVGGAIFHIYVKNHENSCIFLRYMLPFHHG